MPRTDIQLSKSQELKRTLDGLIDGYRDNPEEIAEMLAFKSRFYDYSMNNAMLIHAQNPYSTFVSSFKDWKSKGYSVKRGEHGIKIIFPIRTQLYVVGEKDGKKLYRRVADAPKGDKALIDSGKIQTVTKTSFGVGNVFDISQTTCPPEDYPKFYSMGYSSDQHAALYESLKKYIRKTGVSVNEVDLQSIALRGQYIPADRAIQISDKLNDTEKLSTLSHEYGHALLHTDPASKGKNPSVKELEADCISIMLQQEFGIPLTDTRKRHFVGHYNRCKGLEGFQLEDVLKNTTEAYRNLRMDLDPYLAKEVPADKGKEQALPDQNDPLPDQNDSAPDQGTISKEEKMLDKLKTQYPGLKENSGYFVLDETPGYAFGFDPKAPESLVLWSVDQNGEYRSGRYRHTLDGYDARELVDAGLHVAQIQEILSSVGYDYEPDVGAEPPAAKPEKEILPQENPLPASQKKAESKPAYEADRERSADTLEYIKYGVSILTVAKDMGFTPVKIGSYYSLKEHDSVRIYPETNSFYRFSTGAGGSNINLLMQLGGMTEAQAIHSLKDKYVGNRFDSLPHVEKPSVPAPEPKPFVLPEKTNGKFSRTYAYLTATRCLDKEIVQQCMKDGLIYEDKKHNVIFVGKDAGGEPVYATRHTTLSNSNYKRDVAGSKQNVGFIIDNQSPRLYVTEAPIDALSLMCLHKRNGKDTKTANYMATCGTCKDAALYYRLKTNPKITEVILANDNDEAGKKADQRILKHLQKEFPKIKVSCIKQSQKDINEYLCKFGSKCRKNPKKKSQVQEVER